MQSGSDWVACGTCQRWQHINCDPRQNLGSLADYAEGGKPFYCPDCSSLQPNPEHSVNHNSNGIGAGAVSAGVSGSAPVAAQQVGRGQMPMQHMGGQMGGYPGAGGVMHAPGMQGVFMHSVMLPNFFDSGSCVDVSHACSYLTAPCSHAVLSSTVRVCRRDEQGSKL
jgi:hypothetical protein